MKKCSFSFLLVGVFLFHIPLFASSKTILANTFSNIAEDAIPSIVLVTASKNNKMSLGANDSRTVYGSGFLISSDGYIITSGHVVKDATSITVDYREREIVASLVKINLDIDVAILKINGFNLSYLELGDSNKMKLGEWVVSIGYPFSVGPFLTIGVVSAKNKNLQYQGSLKSFLFTDALINPGNSGGPILNLKNEVIGICTGILLSKENQDEARENQTGIGVAIPINTAKSDIQKFTSLKVR